MAMQITPDTSNLTCHCETPAWRYTGTMTLTGQLYARMFRDYHVPAAYMYKPGTHLHQTAVNHHFAELYLVIGARHVPKDICLHQKYAIVSDGTCWVFIPPSAMKEFEIHALQCNEKHDKQVLNETCKQRGRGHNVKISWKSPDGSGPYEIDFACSCGNAWTEYPEEKSKQSHFL